MDDVEDYSLSKSTEHHSYYNMRILGYVDMTCGMISMISNGLLVSVFAKKGIISPMTAIITHIVISESLSIIAFAPRVWHEYFRVGLCSISEHKTYAWEMISVHSLLVAFVFRHTGVWMAVMLAVWRYIAVKHPLKERLWCNMETTRTWIISGYIFSVIITIPVYFIMAVGPSVKLLDKNGCLTANSTTDVNKTTIYELQLPLENYPIVFCCLFLIYAIFIKILPSLVLGTISYKLIIALIEAKKHRKTIAFVSNRRNMEEQMDRTSMTLIAILALFVIGEVPQGIGALGNAIFGPWFFWKYYFYAFEVFNSLTHISESFNFVVYYAMSNDFRRAFKAIFRRHHNGELDTKS